MSEAITQHPVYTVGHSTHSIDMFLELLRMHAIELVVDVRRFPGSRRLPHFNSGLLEENLQAQGISYRHMEGLGGRRDAVGGTSNAGWRNAAFRGYADHMKTTEFAENLKALMEEARKRPTAVMCAEGLWWKCHRRLIADALATDGRTVVHILPDGATQEHELTEFARVDQGVLFYEA
jgi:uncharacterized protein (DUF488 family)